MDSKPNDYHVSNYFSVITWFKDILDNNSSKDISLIVNTYVRKSKNHEITMDCGIKLNHDNYRNPLALIHDDLEYKYIIAYEVEIYHTINKVLHTKRCILDFALT